jgi:hypothetical protein
MKGVANMSELIWIRSHVERLLQEQWDVGRVTTDSDGDWLFRIGTAACWVSVIETDPIMVRVTAQAAVAVRSSARLLRELNTIQIHALSANLLLTGDTVLVTQTLSPIGLSQPVLAQAMQAVGSVANKVGVLIAGMYGGATPYPAGSEESEDAV